MKKILLFVSVVGMLMVGCSSKEVKTTPVVVEKQNVVTDNRPKWVRTGVGEGFSAMGSFNKQGASESFARNQAMLDARASLATMYKVMVDTYTDAVIKELRGQGKNIGNQTYNDTRNQMARETLVGSKLMDTFYDKDADVFYVLVGVDEASVKSQTEKKFENLLLSDAAMTQQIMAKNDLNNMKKLLDDAYGAGVNAGYKE